MNVDPIKVINQLKHVISDQHVVIAMLKVQVSELQSKLDATSKQEATEKKGEPKKQK